MFDFLPTTIPLSIVITILAIAAIIIGISKSGFGGSTGVIATPLVANLLPIEQTLGFMLPILMIADIIAIKQHWNNQSWKHVRWIVSGATLGVLASTILIFLLANNTATLDTYIKLVVGILCLFFVVFQIARDLGMPLPHIPETRNGGITCGTFTGTVSTLSNAAGPIVAIYMIEQNLGKKRMTATMVFTFAIINWLKVPGFLFLGILSPGAVLLALCFLPFIPVGSLLGIWMHKRVNETLFNAIIYAATALSSFSLVYKSIAP
ncbi:Sulfite exporter TauE/SafE [Poriferisphaera corsica]|uniref:Probable membrane transporter protein n=1 Tax=Poriferisphaera corsica TaxID=2528020 RepID=A0A517YV31_9BACT|nr:sulfite exporter TauE/SafE family protein [Poriferisphaera corsica]QDU34070.1 Sulfite exporter TauE/SafE [Poriferisphaera corsica]